MDVFAGAPLLQPLVVARQPTAAPLGPPRQFLAPHGVAQPRRERRLQGLGLVAQRVDLSPRRERHLLLLLESLVAEWEVPEVPLSSVA